MPRPLFSSRDTFRSRQKQRPGTGTNDCVALLAPRRVVAKAVELRSLILIPQDRSIYFFNRKAAIASQSTPFPPP